MSPSVAVFLQLVAITNTTVVDPSNGTARAGQTIVIRGTRIEAVGDAARTRVPLGARVISGAGTWAIPGLWDMHVHNDVPGGASLLPLYVAHGVTGVRDMDGRLGTLRAWQREVATGRRVGPRMVISGPYIAGQRVPLPHVLATTPTEGAAAVDSLVGLGVDFIKVHNGMNPATYFAAARRARERGVVFAGHVFPPVTPLQASDSGQRSEEHLSGFPNECSSADSARFAAAHPLHRFLLGPCTSAPQGPQYARIARNRTWITPTLIVQRPVVAFHMPIGAGERLHDFWSDSLLAVLAQVMPMPANPSAEHRALGAALYERRVAMVGALARAGVPLLTGSDTPVAPALPGEGIHEELALLVRGGLTPAQALRAATWEAARYLDATDSLGTLSAGKVADVVLLGANPLADIGGVRKIVGVAANGHWFDRAALDALVEGARVRRP